MGDALTVLRETPLIFIERVPSDKTLNRNIQRWQQMRKDGWDLVALLAPDKKTLVALGCHGGATVVETESDQLSFLT